MFIKKWVIFTFFIHLDKRTFSEKLQMSDFRGNIDYWLKESEPDYYLFFLKAWIPFNAWYVAELPHLKRKDSDIIRELQDHSDSKPRKIIENYLGNDDFDSLQFQSHFAELHYNLERTPLAHRGTRLSFKAISLTENPIRFRKDVDAYGNVYKAERTSSYYQAFIEAKDGRVMLDFKQPIYNIDDLKKDSDFIRLNHKIQGNILRYFLDVDPRKAISLISKSTQRPEFLLLKSKNQCRIINDKEIVAKGCIKVLYSLRNMLFHGEVPPNNSNKPIYEHGFYILRYILKGLN